MDSRILSQSKFQSGSEKIFNGNRDNHFLKLQVSQSLINRALNAEQAFLQSIEAPPAVTQYCPRPQQPPSQSHPSTPSHWSKVGGARPAPAHSSFVSLMQLDAIHKVVSDLTLHEGVGKWAIGLRTNTVSIIGNHHNHLVVVFLVLPFVLRLCRCICVVEAHCCYKIRNLFRMFVWSCEKLRI